MRNVLDDGPNDLLFTASRCLKIADTWDIDETVKKDRWKNLVTISVNICYFRKASDTQLLNFFRKLLNFVAPLHREELIHSHMKTKKRDLFNRWLKAKREENSGKIKLFDLFEIIESWRNIKISIAEEISDAVIALFEVTKNDVIALSDGIESSSTASSVITSVPDCHPKSNPSSNYPTSSSLLSKFCENETNSLGYLIFINNYKYKFLDNRVGHEKDTERLQRVARRLGFSYLELTNLDSFRIIEELRQFAKTKTMSPSHKLIVAVGSHGSRDVATNEDFIACYVDHELPESPGSKLKVEDIVRTIEEAEGFEETQKLFLLHFCRKLTKTAGFSTNGYPPNSGDQTDNFSNRVHFPSLQTFKRPQFNSNLKENTWIIYSALPGELAYRTENGSFLFEDFCEVLEEQPGEMSCNDLPRKMSSKLDGKLRELEWDVQPVYEMNIRCGRNYKDFILKLVRQI